MNPGFSVLSDENVAAQMGVSITTCHGWLVTNTLGAT
jgi:hypothetical protein